MFYVLHNNIANLRFIWKSYVESFEWHFNVVVATDAVHNILPVSVAHNQWWIVFCCCLRLSLNCECHTYIKKDVIKTLGFKVKDLL